MSFSQLAIALMFFFFCYEKVIVRCLKETIANYMYSTAQIYVNYADAYYTHIRV